MNHNTNERPSGTAKGERLALAFGRAYDPYDDVSPAWLGDHYVDEQQRVMERVATKRNLTIVAFFTAYSR